MAASLMEKSLCGSEGWPGHVPTTPCQDLPALWESFSSYRHPMQQYHHHELFVYAVCWMPGTCTFGFFHVSVSQHEAKLSQHHQHGQVRIQKVRIWMHRHEGKHKLLLYIQVL